jgi:hypothetical protein
MLRPKFPNDYFKMPKSIAYLFEGNRNDHHERNHWTFSRICWRLGWNFVDKIMKLSCQQSCVDRKNGQRVNRQAKMNRKNDVGGVTPTCRRRRNRLATCWRRPRRPLGNQRVPKSSSPFPLIILAFLFFSGNFFLGQSSSANCVFIHCHTSQQP